MGKPTFFTTPLHQEAFSFLGIQNIVTETSDFGAFWSGFFAAGGYDVIAPYIDEYKPINIWYTNNAGEKIYFQGLKVGKVEKVPRGYSLVDFPASDFLVVTHEWLPTSEEALENIGAGWEFEKNVPIPEGYVRNDGPGSPITIMERENMDTPEGSRYEFWVPIKKAE